ncbi:MAG: dihydroneopterin aldolase [Hyphomonadaceae bacterium]|nr:dihydroneopterin aldolase [Hyphomonadaceae bacterium]
MSETPSAVSIVMKRIELRVRIGEHAWEKTDAQRLHLDLTLEFGFGDYFGKHGGYVDYDPLRSYLKSLEQRDHINRLEDFASDILGACFSLTPAARVTLTILKPDIFEEMEGVGLRFDVTRQDFTA